MRWIWTAVLASVLAGCGGGGGGGSQSTRAFGDSCPGLAPGTVAYSTTWDSAHPNASQLIQILDASGALLRTGSLNRINGSDLNITSVPAGIYEVKATLYDGPNATGQVIGETSVVADLCGTVSGSVVTVRTTAADPVSRVVVQPGATSVQQQSTKRFLAETLAANGTAAFRNAAGVTWQVTGGIGTITAKGVLTATKAGLGTVRAALNGSLVGSSNVTVTAFNPSRSKWTVLVFLNASNDLFPYSDLNVNQMEAVAGKPANLRFVVQWKQDKARYPGSTFDGVRRYLVTPDSNPNMVNSKVLQDGLVDQQGRPLDMGAPGTLLDFVQWGKKYYPADHYALVVWNHGRGWQRKPGDNVRGISYDDQTGNRIDTWQLGQALGTEQFDVIAWDACLMNMLEVAYEVRGNTAYVAGSEDNTPAPGYPYDAAFKGFRDAPDSPTATLCKGFVDAMVQNPPYASEHITQSVIDTSRLGGLAAALDDLGSQLFANRATLGSVLNSVRDNSQAFNPTASMFYRDLFDVCRLLIADSNVPPGVKTAAANVQSEVQSATVQEGHNANVPNSHGIAVDFSSGSVFQGYRADYIQLKLAKDTFWDEFLGSVP